MLYGIYYGNGNGNGLFTYLIGDDAKLQYVYNKNSY